MKNFFSLLLLLVFQYNTFGQTSKLFNIKEVIISDTLDKKKITNFQRESPNFFEDDNYIVRKSCSGEWGGTIWFKNKKTGIEYSCSATCPVIVNKWNGKYVVTNTLAHLSGFSEIIEIENPQSLQVFKLPEPRKKKGKRLIRYVGDDESKSTKGTQKLVDTIGILTLASFPYDGQLFYVITDFRKTFIAKIENKRFVTIDILSDKSIWTYDPEVTKTTDNHFVVFFHNEKVEGYLDIFNNSITLTRYR